MCHLRIAHASDFSGDLYEKVLPKRMVFGGISGAQLAVSSVTPLFTQPMCSVDLDSNQELALMV